MPNRFATAVTIGEPNACWPYNGQRTPQGYGRFFDGTKRVMAHRYAWEQTRGTIPQDQQVLHRCDNPSCVNVAHLFLGTNAENVADKVAKGRAQRLKGERNPYAKLTDDDVRAIRAAAGTHVSIAGRYGITPGCVSHIKLGRSWKHLQ